MRQQESDKTGKVPHWLKQRAGPSFYNYQVFCIRLFYVALQQRNTVLRCFLVDVSRPQGTLHLANVRFAQIKHTDA